MTHTGTPSWVYLKHFAEKSGSADMRSFSVVPSITTHNRYGSTWREKIAELEPLGIRQVGLFVTGLQKAERKGCYRELLALREHHPFSISFVHAVSDMDDAEYAFLRHEFGTRWFNLHPLREFPLIHPLSDETRSFITIENSCFVDLIQIQDLQGFAGLCIDIAHLEDTRLVNPSGYGQILELCEAFPVRANHISASITPASEVYRGFPKHSSHHLAAEVELNYLSQMPKEVVGEVVALELENPLAEQLRLVEIVQTRLAALVPRLSKLAA
jgi:hypothetical protein